MANNRQRWSDEENAVLLRYVKACPQNLTKCFLAVSEQLTELNATTGEGAPRSVTGVASHWYSVLSKQQNAVCLFAASSKHVSKSKKKEEIISSKPSVWERFIDYLKQSLLWTTFRTYKTLFQNG